MKKIIIASIATLGLVTAASAAVNAGACAGCHGAHFEKKALGKSNVVKDMSHAEIATALKGYKAGTRNKHGMGMLMKGQVGKYSNADLEAFSKTIGK